MLNTYMLSTYVECLQTFAQTKIKEFGDESATSSNNPDPPRSTNSTGSELNAKQRKPTNWKENQLLLGKPTGRKTIIMKIPR